MQSVANAIADNGSEGIFRISDNEECMLVSNPFQINLGGGVGSSVVARLPGSDTDECWQSAVTLAETVQEVSQGYDLSDEDASYPSIDNSSFTSVSDSDDDLDIEKPVINVQLARWAIHNRISHSALGSLLSILKPYHAELPCDPRTLLKLRDSLYGRSLHLQYSERNRPMTLKICRGPRVKWDNTAISEFRQVSLICCNSIRGLTVVNLLCSSILMVYPYSKVQVWNFGQFCAWSDKLVPIHLLLVCIVVLKNLHLFLIIYMIL
jgi:hypothetical protein